MISFDLSGATFLNYHETFSKDDVRIPNNFFSEILVAFFAFPKNFFFSYLCKLVQPIRCAYVDHVTYASQFQVLWKTSYLGMPMENNLHSASSSELIKQQYALLTHCLLNYSAMQIISDITYDVQTKCQQ